MSPARHVFYRRLQAVPPVHPTFLNDDLITRSEAEGGSLGMVWERMAQEGGPMRVVAENLAKKLVDVLEMLSTDTFLSFLRFTARLEPGLCTPDLVSARPWPARAIPDRHGLPTLAWANPPTLGY